MSKIRTGAAGISLVAQRVQGYLNSDWQQIDAENDDGVDGVIFLRNQERFLGRMLFVQVKSGTSFKRDYKLKNNNILGVSIGSDYIKTHRPRWNALPGPVVLVYVEDPSSVNSKIYWQDLKSDASYSKENLSVVLIPKHQTFGTEAKGKLKSLTGSVPDSAPLKEIDLRALRSAILSPSFTLKRAREFYRIWSKSKRNYHPELGEILVTNAGWRHITRHGRKSDSILNSMLLLEAAEQMIIQGAGWRQLGSARIMDRSKTRDIVDTLSLRARVSFRQRTAAPVQVILQRVRKICRSTGKTSVSIKFLSVHELQRKNSKYYGQD